MRNTAGIDAAECRRFAAVAVLAGSPSFLVCFGHVCMAGHMKHPPYPLWHFVSDWLWLTLFVSAGVVALASDFRHRYVFSLSCLLMPVLRLGLGSLGGGGLLIEFPAWITIATMSTRGLRSDYRLIDNRPTSGIDSEENTRGSCESLNQDDTEQIDPPNGGPACA